MLYIQISKIHALAYSPIKKGKNKQFQHLMGSKVRN